MSQYVVRHTTEWRFWVFEAKFRSPELKGLTRTKKLKEAPLVKSDKSTNTVR